MPASSYFGVKRPGALSPEVLDEPAGAGTGPGNGFGRGGSGTAKLRDASGAAFESLVAGVAAAESSELFFAFVWSSPCWAHPGSANNAPTTIIRHNLRIFVSSRKTLSWKITCCFYALAGF